MVSGSFLTHHQHIMHLFSYFYFYSPEVFVACLQTISLCASAVDVWFTFQFQKSETEWGPQWGAEPTRKAVNQHSKDVIQAHQQRPESPTVTLTWHACEYKVHKLHRVFADVLLYDVSQVPTNSLVCWSSNFTHKICVLWHVKYIYDI